MAIHDRPRLSARHVTVNLAQVIFKPVAIASCTVFAINNMRHCFFSEQRRSTEVKFNNSPVHIILETHNDNKTSLSIGGGHPCNFRFANYTDVAIQA